MKNIFFSTLKKINIKTINLVFLFCIVGLLFTPILYQFVRVFVFYPLLLCWGITACVIDGYKRFFLKSGFLFLAYISLLYILLFFIYNFKIDYLRHIVTTFLISYVSITMYFFYCRHSEMIGNKYLIIYVFLGFGLLTTIPGLIRFPMASRILATDSSKYPDQFILYKRMGIGGYEYIYTLVAFVVFSPTIFNQRKKLIIVFLVLIHIGFIVCIILSQYTIAIILTLFLTPVSFAVYKFNKNVVFTLFIVFLISLAFLLLIEPILLFLSFIFESLNTSFVSIRINEFLTAINQGSILSLERIGLYNNAWKNIISSPFIGVFYKHTLLKSGHSELLTCLEMFGLFGLIAVVYLVSYIYRQKKHIKSKQIQYCLMCCHVFALIFSYINRCNSSYPFVWSILFILPIIALQLNNKTVLSLPFDKVQKNEFICLNV